MLERLYDYVREENTAESPYEMSTDYFWREIHGDIHIMFSFRWYALYMPLMMLAYKVSHLLVR